MAKEATLLKSSDDWAKSKQAKARDLRRAQRDRRDALASLTFEDLDDRQKDLLLKALAVQAGFIADSPDD